MPNRLAVQSHAPQSLARARRERLPTKKANAGGRVGIRQEQPEILWLKKNLNGLNQIGAPKRSGIVKKVISLFFSNDRGRPGEHFSIHESAAGCALVEPMCTEQLRKRA